MHFSFALLLLLAASVQSLSTVARICKGKGQSHVSPIPHHAYCKERQMVIRTAMKAHGFVMKHSFVKPRLDACLCTASKIVKTCEVWFFGSWSEEMSHQVILPTEKECRDTCREMRHLQLTSYINGTAFDYECNWNAKTEVSKIIIQAEEVDLTYDERSHALQFPGLQPGSCVAPMKANSVCKGKNIMIHFESPVYFEPCQATLFDLGICIVTEMENGLNRMYCHETSVLDYYDPKLPGKPCNVGVWETQVFRTQGNLVVGFDRIANDTDKKETLSQPLAADHNVADWILKSNTDLINQIAMNLKHQVMSNLAESMIKVEAQICDAWKRAMILSDSLLDSNPVRAAEVLVGRLESFKVARILNSIYWTPCFKTTVVFNKTNPNCYKEWPILSINETKWYYDSITNEITSIATSVPCEQLEQYYVNLPNGSVADIVSSLEYSDLIEDVNSYAVPRQDEEIIRTSSLYNISDHEAISNYDLIVGMIATTNSKSTYYNILSTVSQLGTSTTKTNKPIELPGIDSFLKRILPAWLYNIGDIILTILEVIIVIVVFRLTVPIIIQICKAKRGCTKQKSILKRTQKNDRKAQSDIESTYRDDDHHEYLEPLEERQNVKWESEESMQSFKRPARSIRNHQASLISIVPSAPGTRRNSNEYQHVTTTIAVPQIKYPLLITNRESPGVNTHIMDIMPNHNLIHMQQ